MWALEVLFHNFGKNYPWKLGGVLLGEAIMHLCCHDFDKPESMLKPGHAFGAGDVVATKLEGSARKHATHATHGTHNIFALITGTS